MNFDGKSPIYIQVASMIKKQIVSGELKEGEKLPSVRELSSKVKVNPNTAQRVYQELEREGVTFTQRGLGTFVTEDKTKICELKEQMAQEIINHFFKEMNELGFDFKQIKEIIGREIA